jgi:hypothetical protein
MVSELAGIGGASVGLSDRRPSSYTTLPDPRRRQSTASRKRSTMPKKKPLRLPPPEQLRRLCQSLAMLDAIFSPEWQYRLYSFNSRWAKGEMMASMRDGQGDE